MPSGTQLSTSRKYLKLWSVNEKPKITLQLTIADKIFEILGWTFVIAIWFLTIANFANMPDTIPIHYNATGQADGFGGKGHLLTLPLISTILFIGLTILNKFPHLFNYPANITPGNALRHYTNATRLIRYLKLIIVIIFGLIVLQTIRNVNGQISGLGAWFLPLIFGLIFIPLIYYVIKSVKIIK